MCKSCLEVEISKTQAFCEEKSFLPPKKKVVRTTQPLSVTHPHLLEEWDWEYNNFIEVFPDEVTYGSTKKVGWVDKFGHRWEAVIASRVWGKRCPYCSGHRVGYGNDLLTNFPKLCKEWHPTKNTSGPENYTPGSEYKAWWKCKKCDHEWPTVIYNRTGNNSCCPKCSKGNISKLSQKWLDFLSVGKREIKLPGFKFRVDGFDIETNTIYEFLGDYWHGGSRKDLVGTNQFTNTTFEKLRSQTFMRFEKLKAAGYKVFYVWESEYNQGKMGTYL